MDKTPIGDRMKEYERASGTVLPGRLPVIIRLDGKAFHTWVKRIKAKKPFDAGLIDNMAETAKYLCLNIQNAVFAYTQSDEISILLHPYKRLNTDPWFGNKVQKMVSIAAATASAHMTAIYGLETLFDARVFILPEAEVVNYFYWRQLDASRNSVQMVARAYFSHRECQNKNCDDLQEMLFAQKKINWNNLPTQQRRGTAIITTEDGWVIDQDIPRFNTDRGYIEELLKIEED